MGVNECEWVQMSVYGWYEWVGVWVQMSVKGCVRSSDEQKAGQVVLERRRGHTPRVGWQLGGVVGHRAAAVGWIRARFGLVHPPLLRPFVCAPETAVRDAIVVGLGFAGAIEHGAVAERVPGLGLGLESGLGLGLGRCRSSRPQLCRCN